MRQIREDQVSAGAIEELRPEDFSSARSWPLMSAASGKLAPARAIVPLVPPSRNRANDDN